MLCGLYSIAGIAAWMGIAAARQSGTARRSPASIALQGEQPGGEGASFQRLRLGKRAGDRGFVNEAPQARRLGHGFGPLSRSR
jgi:hypothetical protein